MSNYQYESEFEQSLIEYLSTGNITTADHLQGLSHYLDFPRKTRIWEYLPDIKQQNNFGIIFKGILERLNRQSLKSPLSEK